MANNNTRSPMDLMGIYMTPQTGVGQRLRPDAIDRRLSHLPLVPLLLLLAQVNFRADDTLTSEQRIQFARSLLPAPIAARAVELLTSDSRFHVVSSHIATTLALRAMVHCDRSGERETPQDLPHLVGVLLLGCAGEAEDRSANDNIPLEIVRLELWYRLRDYDRWYEVAHRVIFEVLPTLVDDADWIDTRTLIEDATGMTLEVFWALTTTYGIAVANDPTSYRFPKYTDTDHVPNEIVDRWGQFWTTTVSDASEVAASDLDTGAWSFNTFYNKPLLRLEDGTSIAVRPWFLANKATPTGFYSTVEVLLGTDRTQTARWSRLFGKAIEQLGGHLIEEYCPDTELLADEKAIRQAWGQGQACDAVLLGEDWLAVDFVHRRISRATGTTGDFTDLAKDLQRGVVDKLVQIDATLTRGVATKGPPVGKAYPLVVIGAPFPVNGLVLNEIDRMLDKEHPSVIGVDKTKCAPPSLMDIGEFWMLLEVAHNRGTTPASLVEAWLSSPLGLVSFRNWLVSAGPGQPPLPEGGKRRYAKHAARHMFGRDEESTGSDATTD